ncbi:MAG: DegT/DnrJ/EryC1/StrS family aminotransferase, partial [Candidatus Omnitrophica bacterium]|nr:DegT/DnrJ/EryC1/StrS family aminotransferase [Candidatus Omnitrophota bacterium]
MHKIPLLDLKKQYQSIKGEIDSAIKDVIDQQAFIMGKDIKSLEGSIASFCQTKYAIGVSSGTDALLLVLKAAGIGEGDEVITVPFTFIATAEAISTAGATPVFCDVDPKTYLMDPASMKSKITSKTKAVIPVHLYGQCVEMDEILKIAKAKNLKVIEDCAQAIGAKYKGRKAGSLGDAGCISFFPSKNLGCFGDGGMIVTNDEKIASNAKLLRVHGSGKRYMHSLVGYNSRLD